MVKCMQSCTDQLFTGKHGGLTGVSTAVRATLEVTVAGPVVLAQFHARANRVIGQWWTLALLHWNKGIDCNKACD